jgi:hypothetical protein
MVDWDKFGCGGLKEFASGNKSHERGEMNTEAIARQQSKGTTTV